MRHLYLKEIIVFQSNLLGYYFGQFGLKLFTTFIIVHNQDKNIIKLFYKIKCRLMIFYFN